MVSKAADKSRATSTVTHPDSAALNKSIAIFNRTVSVQWKWWYADWSGQIEGETRGISLARNNLSKTLLIVLVLDNRSVSCLIGSIKNSFLDDWGSPEQSWIVSEISFRRKIRSPTALRHLRTRRYSLSVVSTKWNMAGMTYQSSICFTSVCETGLSPESGFPMNRLSALVGSGCLPSRRWSIADLILATLSEKKLDSKRAKSFYSPGVRTVVNEDGWRSSLIAFHFLRVLHRIPLFCESSICSATHWLVCLPSFTPFDSSP